MVIGPHVHLIARQKQAPLRINAMCDSVCDWHVKLEKTVNVSEFGHLNLPGNELRLL